MNRHVRVDRGGLSSDVPIRPDIISAAIEVFSDRGYEGATLDDIANIVGMKKPSLYYHISSKAELLLNIHEELNREFVEVVESAVSESDHPVEQLEAIIRAVTGFVITRRKEVAVHFRGYRSLPPEMRKRVFDNRRAFVARVATVIDRGAAEGYFRSIDSRIAARSIVGMMYFDYEWYEEEYSLHDSDRRDLHEVLQAVSDVHVAIAVDGLRITG